MPQKKKHFSHEAAVTIRSNHEKKIPGLTRREKEVLELIAQGYTNQEIADKLFISSSTADTHRTNLLLKFEVKNVAVLISLASKSGLIKMIKFSSRIHTNPVVQFKR